MFAALTAGAEDRPESRLLDRLAGRWRSTTHWEPIVGAGVRLITGGVESSWIHGGRMLLSRTSDAAGAVTGHVVYAFDPTVGDHVAFAFNGLSSFYALERGVYEPDADRFVFEALEPRRDGKPPVRFQRVIELHGDDSYTMSIGYPDVPPGTYGPMTVTHERDGAPA